MLNILYFLFLTKMHLRVIGLMKLSVELSVLNSAFSCHWLLPFGGTCGVTASKQSKQLFLSCSCGAVLGVVGG